MLATELNKYRTERYSHSCFIFERNKLLSIGTNNTTQESPKVKYFGRKFNVPQFVNHSFLHAEIHAVSLLFGRRHITGKEHLVVLRLNRRGELMQSRPCFSCSAVLRAIGFSSVYHSIASAIVESEL